MKTLMAGALAATLVAGLGILPMSVKAGPPIEMPGGDAFETKLSQQLEDANAEVQSQLLSDPTLAGLDNAATDAAAPEPAPRETVTIDKKLAGVPGDEKFEAAYAAWLEQRNEELKDELSRDQTGPGKLR